MTPAPILDGEPFPFETSSELYPEYGILAGPRSLSLSRARALSRSRTKQLCMCVCVHAVKFILPTDVVLADKSVPLNSFLSM